MTTFWSEKWTRDDLPKKLTIRVVSSDLGTQLHLGGFPDDPLIIPIGAEVEIDMTVGDLTAEFKIERFATS
jgi:heme/copper-type cytochrome/quinol oxidase subunit 2